MNRRLLFVIPCVALTYVAWGSGFQIIEQGASNIGTAAAGAVTNANEDATAAYWNPSAIAFSNFTSKIDSSLSVIVPSFVFSDAGTTDKFGQPVEGNGSGNGGKTALVPNLYMAHKFSDTWMATLAVSSPFGLETCYDNDWIGRYHAVKSDILTLDFNPSIVYKPTDWLSFSVGAYAQYIDADLSSYLQMAPAGSGIPDIHSEIEGCGWSGGATVGATVKYDDFGRIGFSWRSAVKYEISGDLSFSPVISPALNPQKVSADLTLPDVFTVGIYQRLWGDLERFAVMCDYSYTRWSVFEELNIENSGTSVSYTPENWKDTSRVSFGIHYYLDDNITLRIGSAWDESPVKNELFRTPRVPDGDRLWLSCGIGYKYKGINIDLAYTYLMFLPPTINNSAKPGTPESDKGRIYGSYEGHAHVISMQVGFVW